LTSTLGSRAEGRWRAILPQLGVPPAFLNGKHQPCPMCGGKDRARFDDKDGRGTWICSRCGAGDGVALVMALNGWDFPQAAQRIEALIPSAERVEAAPSLSDQRRRELLNALWRSSRPVQPGDPVALWLGRGSAWASFRLACGPWRCGIQTIRPPTIPECSPWSRLPMARPGPCIEPI
jgi:putative DNA primase/helicase